MNNVLPNQEIQKVVQLGGLTNEKYSGESVLVSPSSAENTSFSASKSSDCHSGKRNSPTGNDYYLMMY